MFAIHFLLLDGYFIYLFLAQLTESLNTILKVKHWQKSHKIDSRIPFHIYKILSTSISYLILMKMALITWDHIILMKSKNVHPFTSKKLFQRRNHACWWRASLACINLLHKSLVNEYQPLCLISPQIRISYIVFFYTYSVPFSLMVNP